MKTRSYPIAIFMSFALSILFTHTVLAKNSQLEFDSTVTQLTLSEENANEGTIIILVKGVEVPILVNSDTGIESDNEEIDLAGLSVGDSVKIEAQFADDGTIVAEEIEILERMGEHFRFKGEITDVQFDTTSTPSATVEVASITVLGVNVLVDIDTKITRPGSGLGNRVSPFELVVGDKINVRGEFDGESLWADRIHVGNRLLGQIELDGEVIGATPDGFTINISHGGSAMVIIDVDTEIRGQLVEGALVRVEGMLNEELAILASEVTVRGNGNGQGRRPKEGEGDEGEGDEGEGDEGEGDEGEGDEGEGDEGEGDEEV
ncbi:MAG: DUF5666 domain-containing protein [Pseudomonadales bacterium]|nr:DUF5666 domain-containing protein [Pseudomonadales bacterium]